MILKLIKEKKEKEEEKQQQQQQQGTESWTGLSSKLDCSVSGNVTK